MSAVFMVADHKGELAGSSMGYGTNSLACEIGLYYALPWYSRGRAAESWRQPPPVAPLFAISVAAAESPL